jgi:hypothetical protein
MSTALPDPSRAYAVLIGVAAYRRMAELPAVINNLHALARLFTDSDVWGLPTDHCAVIADPPTVTAALDPIHDAAQSADSALLIYYAGHGLLDDTGELYLPLPDGNSERLHHAVRFGDIRRELIVTASRCPAKVVILDCCYSGRAGFMSGDDQLADQADVEGAYLMTATAETQQALAPVGAAHTGFTGALLDVLHRGVPDGPEVLDMETLYAQTAQDLKARGLPRPQRRSREAGHHIAIARNRAVTNRHHVTGAAPHNPAAALNRPESRTGPAMEIEGEPIQFTLAATTDARPPAQGRPMSTEADRPVGANSAAQGGPAGNRTQPSGTTVPVPGRPIGTRWEHGWNSHSRGTATSYGAGQGHCVVD